MKDTTYNLVKSVLETDNSISLDDKLAILAFCRNPAVTAIPDDELAKTISALQEELERRRKAS
jgi:hypothetical protein